MDLPLLVVDGANVVGSRPDGWWRDRAGAAVRLRDRLVPLAGAGRADLPPPLEVVLVVEGAARGVSNTPQVRVVSAPGSGDDAIVDLVRAAAPGRRCVVVTADRELRARVTDLGAEVRGPRWIDSPGSPEPTYRAGRTITLRNDRRTEGQSGGDAENGHPGSNTPPGPSPRKAD